MFVPGATLKCKIPKLYTVVIRVLITVKLYYYSREYIEIIPYRVHGFWANLNYIQVGQVL